MAARSVSTFAWEGSGPDCCRIIAGCSKGALIFGCFAAVSLFSLVFRISDCQVVLALALLVLASDAFLFVCYLCPCANIIKNIAITIAITIVSFDNFPPDIQDFNRRHLP